MELRINHDFVSCLSPLTDEEFAQLEENILSDGEIREPIIVWDRWVVDGHNRFKIATKHGLPYKTKEKEFPGKDAVIVWILMNQLGRRNLTTERMRLFRGRLMQARVKAGEKYADVRKELCDTFNVGKTTMSEAYAYAEDVDAMAPAVREAIESGQVKVSVREAKELSELPPIAQEMVLGVIEQGAADSITEVIGKADEAPPKPKRAEGVPEVLQGIWEERSTMHGFIQAAGKLLNEIERFCESCKAGFYVDIVSARADLKNLSENIRVSVPWKACTCSGSGCDKCSRLGWLTREQAAGMVKQ